LDVQNCPAGAAAGCLHDARDSTHSTILSILDERARSAPKSARSAPISAPEPLFDKRSFPVPAMSVVSNASAARVGMSLRGHAWNWLARAQLWANLASRIVAGAGLFINISEEVMDVGLRPQ
jgi:hypothetical protein